MWTIEIPMRPPNLNDHLVNRGGGRSRGGRAAFAAQSARYRKVREQWVLFIRSNMNAERIPAATGKRRVSYVRIIGRGEREWEFDNLVGGGKPVFDAMRITGLIVDDSVKLCERVYSQRKGDSAGVVLEIEDV